MEPEELFRHLSIEYWGIREANPDWDKSLAQFLIDRGMSQDDIWSADPETAYNENWPEPDWL